MIVAKAVDKKEREQNRNDRVLRSDRAPHVQPFNQVQQEIENRRDARLLPLICAVSQRADDSVRLAP